MAMFNLLLSLGDFMKFIKNISLFCLFCFVATTSFGMEKELVEISESKIDWKKTPFSATEKDGCDKSLDAKMCFWLAFSQPKSVDKKIMTSPPDSVWYILSFLPLFWILNLRGVNKDTGEVVFSYITKEGEKYPIFVKLTERCLFNEWYNFFFREFLKINVHPLKIAFDFQIDRYVSCDDLARKVLELPDKVPLGVYKLKLSGSSLTKCEEYLNSNDLNKFKDFENLKSLKLVGIDLYRSKDKKIGFKNLESLQFIRCDSSNPVEFDLEKIKKIKVLLSTTDCVRMVGHKELSHCEELTCDRGFYFSTREKLDDVFFGKTVMNSTRLKKLTCLFNLIVNKCSIEKFAKNFARITFLSLSAIETDIKDQFFKYFQNLRELKILGGNITNLHMKGLSSLKKLKKVHLLKVKKVTDEGLYSLPATVEFLDISFFAGIYGLGLRHLKKLKALNLSNNDFITEPMIIFLLPCFPDLKTLDLSSCRNITKEFEEKMEKKYPLKKEAKKIDFITMDCRGIWACKGRLSGDLSGYFVDCTEHSSIQKVIFNEKGYKEELLVKRLPTIRKMRGIQVFCEYKK